MKPPPLQDQGGIWAVIDFGAQSATGPGALSLRVMRNRPQYDLGFPFELRLQASERLSWHNAHHFARHLRLMADELERERGRTMLQYQEDAEEGAEAYSAFYATP